MSDDGRGGTFPHLRSGLPPDSGEKGVRPPEPGTLPRPKLWPRTVPGEQSEPFVGREEQTSDKPAARKKYTSWVAVALMVVGATLVGFAVALMSWAWGIPGVVLGAVGAVLALRSRIMEDVSVTDSPHGRA